MNVYIAFLKREFILFIKDIIPKLLLYSIFPIILFLFLMVPLNKIIDTNTGMSYLYHGMPSIIFVSTSMISFMVPLLIIKRDINKCPSWMSGLSLFYLQINFCL